MDILIVILCVILIICMFVCTYLIMGKFNVKDDDRTTKQDIVDLHKAVVLELQKSENNTITSVNNYNNQQIINLKNDIQNALNSLGSLLTQSQKNNQETMNELVRNRLVEIQDGLARVSDTLEKRLSSMQQNTQESLKEIREENSKKLDEIRGTVDEKLTETLNKRINESFQTVSNQLEQVYKSIGEMQSLAGEVGSLKQVLSGVKTRGILGEIQLGAILSEILTGDQYEENIATIPGSTERVEFAIKLPGSEGKPVYLPVDSKFPADSYHAVVAAREEGDKVALENAKKILINTLKTEAKDIKNKYVEPPYTTSFGIMFLPFEGLYAEVVNLGMVETLQHDYNINICGPSTMAALLNSLQMGFKTLAIQKRSDEVWHVLGEVKSEFGKFEDGLKNMQRHLDLTSKDLGNLLSTRTNAINRKLRDVEVISANEEQVSLVDDIND